MDDKIRKICKNCCQLYHIKQHSSSLVGNLPLFLSCGHTICENCIRSRTKYQEPIECKVCLRSMEIKAGDVLHLAQNKSNVYEMFPVNYLILGELTLQLMQNDQSETPNEECFIDVQAILNEKDIAKDKCVECHNLTTKFCKQCETILCDSCFNKTHKNFVIFKNHALQKIVTTPETNNNCKVHDDKQLDYYCTDCSKAVCMDCLLVGSDKSCKDHNLKSTSEINDYHMEQIINIQPKVDEIFNRLTKTSVEIGQLLYKIDSETGSEVTKIITEIEQHFSKLCSIVQKHKEESINNVNKAKLAEKQSLLNARNYVYEAMIKARKISKVISNTADSTMFKQMNLSVLLEDSKKITETPWYLFKEEDKNNTIKLKVNEDLNELISDYIQLEGNAAAVYKLCTPAELGEGVEIPSPPSAPVFPPQMTKDVRQLKNPKEALPKSNEEAKPMTFFKQAPSYRSKSESVNSLNSCSSGSSRKSFLPINETFQGVAHIKPYTENQILKPLYEGTQELIFISHIVNPHNFFIQQVTYQKLVKVLMKEYRNAVSLPKPLLTHVAEGKTYLAFSKVDNVWQRCHVISIDKIDPTNPKFNVFCFDFGNVETVSLNHLRLLPPAKWHSPPPLAINCRLANCEPINGEWTNDDSILIQNIIDNKQAVMHIRRITETPNGTKLECDITTFEDKVSLAHALVFHERAKMPNPKLRYPFINNIRESPKIFISNNDFKPKTVDDVNLTHVVSPDKFFVRKCQHQEDFYRLAEELNQEYSLVLDTGKIYLPEIGMACVVNTEKYRNTDNSASLGEEYTWARCVVTEIGLRGRIRVQLVDCGTHLYVHWTALRVIQMRFTTLRGLATECHLAGVTPLNKKWSPTSVALLKKYQNHTLEMRVVENRNRGSIGVTLFDNTDEQNSVCINNEMVKYKFAITFGMFNFNTEQDLKDQTYTHKTPLDRPVKAKKQQNKITILKKDAPKKTKDNELIAKDKGPLRLEAKVVQYLSPSIIYVSLVHQQKMFNEMFENIQKFYSSGEGKTKTEWNVGDKCCTLCAQSQTWRRATILELLDDNAKVFYTDFACVETVAKSQLKELTSEFASTGVAAIKCHMCGVMPAIGEEWPSITKEFLKELLDAYQRIFITKLGHFKENSMPIEIWVYHTIQGGALEPDKSEWRCLNKKIIEQGLGIPIKSEQSEVDNDVGNDPEEDTLKFLNVTGSVREWLQLEPMPTKPLITKTETESVSGSSTAVECEDTPEIIDFKTSNNIFISEWLPAEPLRNNEFTALATFVDNDGIIYLHDIAQEGTFDLIRNALNVRYQNPDPKAKYMKWSIGEPCVALYHYDNSFYRGLVVEVNEVTSNCLVHYIDYGNEELCSFNNMRKSIALHQIPIQAHKCVFNRIQPVGNQWDRQALDYIHKLIVEKQCYVKVSGKAVNGIASIDMKYDKIWINDHLVDFELAKYKEGTKALDHKYNEASTSKQTLCEVASAVDPIEPPYNLKNSEPDNIDSTVNVDISDDEPDFIVESDEPELAVQENDPNDESSEEDETFNELSKRDWNSIIAEDEESIADTIKDITFPKWVQGDEFKCTVVLLNDAKVIPLNTVIDKEINNLYEELFNELQTEAYNMPKITEIFKYKACIALFDSDQKWYRASIMEYSPAQGLVKVRYVDYGNIELVSLTNVREIHQELASLPPLVVPVKLHGVDINPELDTTIISKELANVFLGKGPFSVKIITNADIPTAELIDDETKEPITDKLIEKGVYLKIKEID